MNKTLAIAMMSMTLAACSPSVETSKSDTIGRRTDFSDSTRQFTPEIMWQMGRISGLQLSEDGTKAVYGVTYYSVEKNKSRSVIYVSTPGVDSTEMLLTQTGCSEHAPSFIPNTGKVAFLAPDANDCTRTQLWMMNPDGTDRKQISFETSHVNKCFKMLIIKPKLFF